MGVFLLNLKRLLRKNRALYLAIGYAYALRKNAILQAARRKGYDGNTVVFSAFDCRSYNDSPRLISEALHALRPQTNIVWLFNDVEKARQNYDIPGYVRALPANSPEGLRAMGGALVVVDNYNKPFFLKFPGEGQCYIQTWHGDRPFKKIGFDYAGQHLLMLEERCSLFLTGSDYGERIIRSAFHYRGEVLKQGLPRNDLLVRGDPELAASIRRRLGVDADVRLLLYAPTFRDSEMRAHQQQRVPLDLHRALDSLGRATGERWLCLVRAHYMSFGIPLDASDARLIPVSDYPEMTDLLLASDALLTDYSSCAGDYVLLGRPIFLYQDDPEGYRSADRDLYVDMKNTPYWVASNPDELDALIAAATPERVRKNCTDIMRYHGMNETGHATRSAVDYILDRLEPSKRIGG